MQSMICKPIQHTDIPAVIPKKTVTMFLGTSIPRKLSVWWSTCFSINGGSKDDQWIEAQRKREKVISFKIRNSIS